MARKKAPEPVVKRAKPMAYKVDTCLYSVFDDPGVYTEENINHLIVEVEHRHKNRAPVPIIGNKYLKADQGLQLEWILGIVTEVVKVGSCGMVEYKCRIYNDSVMWFDDLLAPNGNIDFLRPMFLSGDGCEIVDTSEVYFPPTPQPFTFDRLHYFHVQPKNPNRTVIVPTHLLKRQDDCETEMRNEVGHMNYALDQFRSGCRAENNRWDRKDREILHADKLPPITDRDRFIGGFIS